MNIPLLHLSLIENIGPAAIQKILTYADVRSLEVIYHYHRSDFIHCGLTEKQADLILASLQDISLLDKEIALIEKHAIKVITLLDNTYPLHLKEIHIPPAVLYYRGENLMCAEKSLAVIGSRLADRYGQRVIDTLIPPLVEKQWTIVSGGALGADTMAHQKTVDVGGVTIVVLGSGLLQPYPAKNKRLFESVVHHGGVILSAFPLMMQAIPGSFPARNRIIAGLSRGCIVVQAAQKSGARITAEFALEQGRDVFAVPGAFDDPLSIGCHALISDGAQLIMSAQDVLKVYGEEDIQVDNAIDSTVQRTSPVKASTQQSIEQVPHASVTTSPILACPLQQAIVAACSIPRSFEYLMTHTTLPLSELQSILFEIQLLGYIQQDFTGQWIAIH